MVESRTFIWDGVCKMIRLQRIGAKMLSVIPSTKGVVGLQFAGSGSFPSFNIYVSSIETGGGELLVSIFDSATA
jgi:hypothetical protein